MIVIMIATAMIIFSSHFDILMSSSEAKSIDGLCCAGHPPENQHQDHDEEELDNDQDHDGEDVDNEDDENTWLGIPSLLSLQRRT